MCLCVCVPCVRDVLYVTHSRTDVGHPALALLREYDQSCVDKPPAAFFGSKAKSKQKNRQRIKCRKKETARGTKSTC